MTVDVFHHAERFLESGGMFGNSAASALGKPDLEYWELFTRETLQNSWDARDQSSSTDGVTYAVDYVELDRDSSDLFRNFFEGGSFGLPGMETLLQASNPVPLLLVCDTGTSGLQGSTSAASNLGINPRDDFASFVRNIGRPTTKEMKGGTYGFGKGVLFAMSDVNTVLIYTRTVDENFHPVTRFIAMANSESFESHGRRYSGRHWWGQKATGETGNPYVEPFTESDADRLAHAFGMDRHFNAERPTGTTIAVISPRVDDADISTVLTRIGESLTRWAWPHMVTKVEGLDPIDFSVTNNGEVVPIPDPDKDPLLNPFVKAYRTCLSEPEPSNKSEYRSEWVRSGLRQWVDLTYERRPAEYLGRLATVSTPTERISSDSVLSADLSHHIALIRNPRMVVTYWPGPAPEGDRNYAGVFVAARDLDPFFAASEPTAHDEWNSKSVDLRDPKLLDGTTKKPRSTNPVARTFLRLKEHLKPQAFGDADTGSSPRNSNVTAISNDLGSIFSNSPGSGVRVSLPTKSSNAERRPSKGVRTSIALSDLISSPQGIIAVYDVEVKADSAAREEGVEVDVVACSVIEGKKIRKADSGVALPEPLGWIAPEADPSGQRDPFGGDPSAGPLLVPEDCPVWTRRYAFLQPADTAIEAEITVSVGWKED